MIQAIPTMHNLGHGTSEQAVLLQYSTTPGSHGSVKFFYARIADISMGVTLTSLFTLVMPW